MEEHFADFWDHIQDLRQTFVRSIVVVGVGFVVLLIFHQPILHFFTFLPNEKIKSGLVHQKVERIQLTNTTTQNHTFELPIGAWFLSNQIPVENRNRGSSYLLSPGQTIVYEQVADPSLLIMGPIEGISLVFKTCFWLSLALTAPIWGWVWLQFILPGLRKNERTVLYPFITLSLSFLAIGITFAYYVTLPVANQYLLYFNNSIGKNAWTLLNYMDYVLLLCLGHAVAAELALLLFVLVHFRFFSAEVLIAKRRHMIVVAFVLGALLTPPDILTQLLLATPLLGVYEGAIQYAKWRNRKCQIYCRGDAGCGNCDTQT